MPHHLARPRVFRALILALAASGPASTLAQPPASNPPARRPFSRPGAPAKVERVRTFDVQHIKGELTLDTKKGEIRGTVTHTLAPLIPGLDSVTLDCGADLKVSKVAAGPAACTFTRKGDELVIILDRAYGPDDSVALAITYSGSPDKGIRFIKPDAEHPDRGPVVWTQGEPVDARHWIPCYDEPNERATAEMIVTVDKPLTVVSNGVLAATRDNGDGTSTFHWKMDGRLAAYLLTLTAGDFAAYHDKVGDLPVDYYVLKDVDEATARRAMGKTPRMIEFFNRRIGTPYAYAKYAQICLPEFGGGMENSSATSMTDTILTDAVAHAERDADSIVAHELAHQWFGDLLTCRDWSNIWLNEGFASYFDPLYTEYEQGPDAFAVTMLGDLRTYLATDRQYRRPIVEARYGDPWEMFDGVTYAKGACVLHALRGTIGDDTWWRGLQLYVARNKDNVVATDDFRAAMEEVSKRDLGWFFDQWVFHGGHPELAARWRYEDDDRTVRLKVEQTQAVDATTPLFRLPTTVEIGDEGGFRTVPVVIDARTQEFVIPAPTRPKLVRIDPQGWLPKVLTFDKPVAEWIHQLDHAANALGRIEAAQALLAGHREDRSAAEALGRAWSRERDRLARAELVKVLAGMGEPGRGALLDAAKDPEARVRVEAVRGLAALPLDPALDSLLRATCSDGAAPYGARSAALGALARAKAQGVGDLIAAALRDPANGHSLARSALGVVLARDDRPAREAAVLYSRAGQPAPLRAVAIPALARQAKDDPQAERLLVALLDDPSPRVQGAASSALAAGGFTAALPRLEQQLAKLTGRARQQLEPLVADLKRKAESAPTPDPGLKEAAELDRQAADLDLQAKDLRNRAEGLRIKAERAKQAPPKPAS